MKDISINQPLSWSRWFYDAYAQNHILLRWPIEEAGLSFPQDPFKSIIMNVLNTFGPNVKWHFLSSTNPCQIGQTAAI